MKKSKISAFSLIELSIVILVIGLLIAGVATGSKLIRDSRLKTARAFSQSSVVSGLDGLVFWLDATAENTITNSSNSYKISDQDRIKTIKSNHQGSKNVVFSEASSNAGPKYILKGPNQLPTMYFNGAINTLSGDCLKIPFSNYLDPRQFTMFIVFQGLESQTGGGGTLYSNNIGSSTDTGFYVSYMASGGRWMSLYFGSIEPLGLLNISSKSRRPLLFSMYSANTPNRSGPASNVFINSINSYMESETPYLANSGGGSGIISLGCNISASSFTVDYFNGYISEVILLDRALSDEDRKEVEVYLMKKYNIKK